MILVKELEKITASQTLSEADYLLSDTMSKLGCDKFSYNYYPVEFNQTGKALHVLCTEHVQGWQEHYTSKHYDQIDPIFNNMRKSHLPLGWKVEEELHKHGKQQKDFFTDALDFGFRGGFGVPIHAPFGEFANLVVQDKSILKLISERPSLQLNLQLLAYHYHSRIHHLLKQQINNPQINLSARELECLELTARHKTAKEIAKILNITPRTVGFHIENAMRKLQVSNKYQAVTKAKQFKLIF